MARMSPPDAEAARRRRLLLTLGLGTFAGALATRVADPFVPEIAGEFGVAPGTAALLATAFSLPYAFVQPVLGPVGDAIGKRRVISAGLFVLAGMLLACALAPGFGWLVLARALAGAAGGAVMPLTLAVVGDAVPLKDRQVALSQLLMFAITGQIAGGVLAGAVGGWLGWRGVFLAVALAALGGALVLAAAMRQGVPEPASRFDAVQAIRRYRTMLASRTAQGLYVAVAIEGALVFGAFPFFAVLLAQRGIGSLAEAGLAVGAFGCGGFAYAMSARRLLAALGQGRMVRLGGLGCGAAMLGLALAPHALVFGAAAFVLGGGFYMIHSSIQTRVTELAPQARGSAVALHAFSFFCGQSLGPVLFGAAIGGVGAVPALAAAGAGLVALAWWLGRR